MVCVAISVLRVAEELLEQNQTEETREK